MPRSDVDICNLGITRAGGEPIDAIDEETPLGAWCFANYPQLRDWALSLHRWTFATRIVRLAELGAPEVRPLDHVFLLPADLVGGVHAYRAQASVDGQLLHRHIMTKEGVALDCAAAFAEYTARVAEAAWPSPFVEFVATALASGVALVKQARTLSSELWARAVGPRFEQGEPGGLLFAAIQADGRNAPERRLGAYDPGPLVTARYAGAPGGLALILPSPPTFIDFS